MQRNQRYVCILSTLSITALPLIGCDATDNSARVETGHAGGALTAQAEKKPQNRIPDELIVKFASTGDQAVTECVATRLEQKRSFAQATADQSSSLDNLMKRFDIRKAEPLLSSRRGLTTTAAYKMMQPTSAAALSSEAKEVPDIINIYRLTLPDGADEEAALRAFQADPHVVYAEPNYLMEAHYTPDDPFLSSTGSWGQPFADLWNLAIINAETAWDTARGDGVLTAVVDTGVDMTNPDLIANIWTNTGEVINGIDDDGNGFVDDVHGWDFINGDNDPSDDVSHGTHVAGILAAEDNNHYGVVGVAPDVRIMPVKTLSRFGGDTFTLSRGILYAVQNGARVINNSWGCSNCPPNLAVEDVVRYAHAMNVAVVFSSGNERADVQYASPAGYPYALTVSGTGPGDGYYDWSCRGELDVAAPAAGIYDPTAPVYLQDRGVLSLLAADATEIDPGLVVDTDFYRTCGTSMAAPHVSGLAALILSQHPTYTPEMVRQVIRRSAVDLGPPGYDILYGYGRIDVAAALSFAGTPLSALITGPIRDVPRGQNMTVTGMANGTDFSSYVLEVGETEDPPSWTPLASSTSSVQNGVLGDWNVPAHAVGIYTLRLRAFNAIGTAFEDRQRVYFENFFISSPTDTSMFRAGDIVRIEGTASAVDFDHYRITITDPNGNPAAADIIGTTPVEQGLLGTWDTAGIANGEYDIQLSLYDSSGGWLTDDAVRVVVDPLLHPGWPVELPGVDKMVAFANTSLADVNLDGTAEILVGYHNVNILKHDGTALSGWPKKVRPADPDTYTQRAPAVGDIDDDGRPEIVAGNNTGWIAAWNEDGSLVSGFPLQGAPGNHAAIALEDIDMDGVLDIVANWAVFGVQVRRGSGQSLPGWSTLKPVGQHQADTPTVADLDGDGRMEIVASYAGPFAPHLEPDDDFAVFSADGNLLPGFPITLRQPSGHAVGDLDRDGDLEIVVTTHDNAVYAFHHDGSSVAGWPAALSSSVPSAQSVNPPTVLDLDGDGVFEVLAGAWEPMYSVLYALDGAANPLWTVDSPITWDNPPRGFAASAAADLNGDGTPEIITSKNIRGVPSQPGLAVYDSNGVLDTSLSRYVASAPSAGDTTPAFADTDGDGLLEMVWVGAPCVIHQWDLNVPVTADAPWPMFHGNSRHTGYNIPSGGVPIPARIEAEKYDRYFDTTAGNQGGACDTGDNVDKGTISGSNCTVGWTAAGEWLEYDVFSQITQPYDITLRLASDLSGKTCRVEIDGVNVTGSVSAPSAGWDAYQNRVVENITITKGDHNVRVFMENGLLNFDYIQFDVHGSTPPGSVNLGAEHSQTSFTASGTTSLQINQLVFGWTPQKILVGFTPLDGQLLNGVSVIVNGTTTALSGWWQTLSIPYTHQTQISLTVNAPSTRQLRAEWWAE